jgi:hypothetical protein
MQQVTWRAPDHLVERVRAVAALGGQSMNEFLTRVLDAATNPDLGGTEPQRIRERLAQAGLLAPPGAVRRRPDAHDVARARRAAGTGTPLADIVTRDRT